MIRKILAFMLFLAAFGARAAADPTPVCTDAIPCHLRMRDATTLTKPDGVQYLLPPGHFYDEPTWQGLDSEVRRLQDSDTRLKAENQSLRGSLASWQPGWLTITTAFLAGAVAVGSGYYWYEHR